MEDREAGEVILHILAVRFSIQWSGFSIGKVSEDPNWLFITTAAFAAVESENIKRLAGLLRLRKGTA